MPYLKLPVRAERPEDLTRAKLIASIDVLYTLFREAHVLAHRVMEKAGWPERIVMKQGDGERRYSLTDQRDPWRFVSMHLALPARDGHLFGGAYVTSGQTREAIYLVPSINGDQPAWTVVVTGTYCSAAVILDVFASVFWDDRAATDRVVQLSGFDLFQTPWS
jgi:hypothetical protein